MAGEVTTPPAAPRAAFADCGAARNKVDASRRVAAAVVVLAAMVWIDLMGGAGGRILLDSRFSFGKMRLAFKFLMLSLTASASWMILLLLLMICNADDEDEG